MRNRIFAYMVLGFTVTLAAVRALWAAGYATTPPTAVPTFESMGITWSPEQGALDNICTIRHRKQEGTDWKNGYLLFYNDIDGKYRGSLVHLTPESTYEIELALSQGSIKARIKQTTWSEKFPVAQTIEMPSTSNQTLLINRSGTPPGYILYTFAEGGQASIEMEGHNRNIRIWGNYMENTFQDIATRPSKDGPIYIWQNVFDASRKWPTGSWDNDRRGSFHKPGNYRDTL